MLSFRLLNHRSMDWIWGCYFVVNMIWHIKRIILKWRKHRTFFFILLLSTQIRWRQTDFNRYRPSTIQYNYECIVIQTHYTNQLNFEPLHEFLFLCRPQPTHTIRNLIEFISSCTHSLTLMHILYEYYFVASLKKKNSFRNDFHSTYILHEYWLRTYRRKQKNMKWTGQLQIYTSKRRALHE